MPYRLWSEAVGESGAEITAWTPDMESPDVITGDNNDPETFLVSGLAVRRVLVMLEAGRVDGAIEELRAILPDLPELPVFEIVETPRNVTAPEMAHVTW